MPDEAENINEVETAEHVFYNVLPPEKAAGPLANAGPGSAAMANPPAVASSVVSSSFLGRLNKRLLVIISAAVVIVALGGWFGYRLLHKPAATTPPSEPPANTAPVNTAPQQPAGVTTPEDWQQRYFGTQICANVTVCGDSSDPDRDGLSNIDEYNSQTDPNNPDSSGGGLADGDKVHVFGGDPLKVKTKDGQYTDADYAKYGYDLSTDQPFTADKVASLKAAIQQYGLHEPTIKTLGPEALAQYGFTSPAVTDPTALDPSIDQSAGAKLARDTQRLDSIKKIGAGLLKYFAANKTYPDTTDFNQMVAVIKPLITVATNFTDPINKNQYVYGYVVGSKGQDFTLTYYSETQSLLIKYGAQAAQADVGKDTSTVYDDQRTRDLENLRVALLLYSSHNVDAHSTQQYVFPPVDQYKTALVPTYITEIPKDPKTLQYYDYQVNDKFDTFTLKAPLDSPPTGTTGYMCNQEECKNY
jgi:hypothetical protein